MWRQLLCILCNERRIWVSATKNHRISNTRSSAMLQTTWYKMLSFPSWCTCKITVVYLRMKRFIDRSVGVYFFGPPCTYLNVRFRPLQTPHRGRVDGRQYSQVRVEVVQPTQMLQSTNGTAIIYAITHYLCQQHSQKFSTGLRRAVAFLPIP